MAGNSLAVDVSNGQIHVNVGADPVFIEHFGAPVAAAAPQPPTSTFVPPGQPPVAKPGIAGPKGG